MCDFKIPKKSKSSKISYLLSGKRIMTQVDLKSLSTWWAHGVHNDNHDLHRTIDLHTATL